MPLKIYTDGFAGYNKRALARARKLDRKERIKPAVSITFEDPIAMAEILTVQRVRLFQQVRVQPASISELARVLKRDASAVRKDVERLERAGVVTTLPMVNPGHGRMKIVSAVAKEYRLTTIL